ncbi:hypothetical protein BN1708_020295, partial [Verticillium longisporum]
EEEGRAEPRVLPLAVAPPQDCHTRVEKQRDAAADQPLVLPRHQDAHQSEGRRHGRPDCQEPGQGQRARISDAHRLVDADCGAGDVHQLYAFLPSG